MALRLYAATTSPGKLRDFRTAAQAFRIEIEPLPGMRKNPCAGGRRRHISGQRDAEGGLLFALCAGRAGGGRRLGAGSGCARRRSRCALGAICRRRRPGGLARRQRQHRRLEQHAADPAAWMADPARSDGAVPLRSGGCARRRGLQWPRARCEGIILDAPRGRGGFGYDPLFYLPELGKTMAEIDLETKLSISHRGRAIAAVARKPA